MICCGPPRASAARERVAQARVRVVSTTQADGAGDRFDSAMDDVGESGAICAPASIEGVPTLVATFGKALGICSERAVVDLLSETLSTRFEFRMLDLAPSRDYTSAAAQLISPGWTVRDHAPLPLKPPLDWGAADQDDVYWRLQLNSMAPASPLLGAAIVQGSQEALDRMRALALDWIQYNMVRNEPNAMKWHDQATGYRAHYLAILYRELLARKPHEVASLRAIVWALLEHGRWLADPAHVTIGNHWLYMMLGLRSIRVVLPETPETLGWGEYAVDGVLDYVDKRVSSEGISFEHSPGYQRYVAATLKAFMTTGLFGGQLLQTRTQQMLSQLVWMVNPSGQYVNIGTSKGNYSMGMSSTADFAASDGATGDEPPAAPIGFPEGGIAMLRSPWSEHPYENHAFVYFMAAFHSTAHKHADHFTFEWNDDGVPIVVDSGEFTTDQGPMRTFFRGTRASNTVEIDRTDYPLTPSCMFGSALTDWGSTPSGLQYVAGHIDHCVFDVSHDRIIAIRPHHWLLVTDWLDGGATQHEYRQWFGFHESAELVSLDADSVLMRLGNGEDLYVRVLGGATSVEHARGREEPDIQGWISHEYYERTPRDSVAFVANADRTVLSTLMTLSGPAESVQFGETDDGIALRFETEGGGVQKVVLRTDRNPTLADGQ